MRKFLLAFILIYFSSSCFGSVVLLGTRFIINDKTSKLKINLVNDNEGEYLIKSNIKCDNNDRYIVTPPLFILSPDKTTSITIIKDNIEKDDTDHICKLIVAMIPKTTMNQSSNIAIATRANLNLIYRHDKLTNADLTKLKLIKIKSGDFALLNDTSFALTIRVEFFDTNQLIMKKTMEPYSSIPIKLCVKSTCSLLVSIINEDESILQKIHLFST